VDEQRHKRLRFLVRRLNKERKKQAQKIDILCNDLIAAQRNFIKRLSAISFIASFCESIVGATDQNNLLYTAVRIIKAETAGASVIFFLKNGDDPSAGLRAAAVENAKFPTAGGVEACFGPELIDGICKSNKVCTLEDMFAMGLQGNLVGLNKISAVTIPLGLSGSSLGFILLYRSSQNKFTLEEIEKISAITYGLCRAIASCRTLSGAA
jgi:hypothetical protein